MESCEKSAPLELESDGKTLESTEQTVVENSEQAEAQVKEPAKTEVVGKSKGKNSLGSFDETEVCICTLLDERNRNATHGNIVRNASAVNLLIEKMTNLLFATMRGNGENWKLAIVSFCESWHIVARSCCTCT